MLTHQPHLLIEHDGTQHLPPRAGQNRKRAATQTPTVAKGARALARRATSGSFPCTLLCSQISPGRPRVTPRMCGKRTLGHLSGQACAHFLPSSAPLLRTSKPKAEGRSDEVAKQAGPRLPVMATHHFQQQHLRFATLFFCVGRRVLVRFFLLGEEMGCSGPFTCVWDIRIRS